MPIIPLSFDSGEKKKPMPTNERVSMKSAKTGMSRNAVANLAWIGFGALVSFFLSPFVVHKLGADGFGVWSLIAGLLGYLGLLDIGIRQAVNKYVAHYHAVDSHEECTANVSVAFTIFVVGSSLAILLSLLLSVSLPWLFNIPEHLIGDAQIIVGLGGITVAVSLIVGVYGGIISGIQRFDVQAVLEIFTALVRAGGTVAVLSYGYGLIGLSLVHVAASVINLLNYRFAARKLYPQVQPKIVSLLNERTRQLLSFSVSTFAIVVLSMFIFNSDNIVIAVLLPVEAVAYYAIAANLVSQAGTLTTAFSYLLTPRVSALSSRQSPEIPGQVITIGKYAMLLILPVALSFLVRGETFLRLWMGPAIAAESTVILTLLSFLLWLNSGRSIIISSLTGLGQHQKLIPAFVIEAVANIFISVVLAQSLGLVGVAIGTLVPGAVVSGVIIPRYLRQIVDIRLRDYYLKTIILPTASAIPFAMASHGMEQATDPSGLAVFFLQILVLLPLIPAFAWLICLDENDRRKLTAGIRSITSTP